MIDVHNILYGIHGTHNVWPFLMLHYEVSICGFEWNDSITIAHIIMLICWNTILSMAEITQV